MVAPTGFTQSEMEDIYKDLAEISEGYDYEVWKEMRERGRLDA